jgi:oxygen-independent coproporphyrinogen-3 oxidase
VAAWRDELARAIAEAGDHLSLYQLTVEPDTPFATLHAAGKLATPDDDTARALYDATQDVCDSRRLPAYEISNHARPGGECRHNLVYWRYGEYAGIGPGAHGRLDIAGRRYATAAEKNPERWLTLVETHGHGLVVDDLLTRTEQADELLLMGLRLAEGIELARYADIAGKPLDAERIADLARGGLIQTTPDGRLRVTAAGFPVLDAVVADLAA